MEETTGLVNMCEPNVQPLDTPLPPEVKDALPVKESDENVVTLQLPNDQQTIEQQKARAFLRDRFLRAMNGLAGKPMEIEMFENTKVTAEFGCSDIEFEHIQVRNLATPIGLVPDALLRTADIVSIKIPLGDLGDSGDVNDVKGSSDSGRSGDGGNS